MSQAVIILHGWSSKMSRDKYKALENILKDKGYKVYVPNLPGFAGEKMIKKTMVLDDYVDFVKKIIAENKLSKPIIIGHSFGGRIAAKLAANYPEKIGKIVFIASPLIKNKLNLKKRIFISMASMVKAILQIFPTPIFNFFRKVLYAGIGEWDYYNAGKLRETLRQVISEDLKPLLSKIKIPVLIIWGKNDNFVSVKDAWQIAKEIPKANVVILEKEGHRLPYEAPDKIFNVIASFLKRT